jgi:hypothetical protein
LIGIRSKKIYYDKHREGGRKWHRKQSRK